VKLSQDEESLTTPPSEGYFEQKKTPAKFFIDSPRSRLEESTPQFAAVEEESLITPPSERYVTDNDAENVATKTPRKTAEIDEQAICTPLKALKEAVRLATPSPVKHPIQRRNFPVTPGKWFNVQMSLTNPQKTPLKSLSSAASLTPSPCRRPPTTPAKWLIFLPTF
jgi:hypothetical protein